MNLTKLIDSWEQKKKTRSIIEQAVFDECITDIKMLVSGEMKQPYSLDSISPFKRHNGISIREAIDVEAKGTFFDWALETLKWFSLDEDAHTYLCDVQRSGDKYNDTGYDSFSDHYNDLKR